MEHFTGPDKSCTCVGDVFKITNLTSHHNWLFFNKYAHEHTFSVSLVHEATLRN